MLYDEIFGQGVRVIRFVWLANVGRRSSGSCHSAGQKANSEVFVGSNEGVQCKFHPRAASKSQSRSEWWCEQSKLAAGAGKSVVFQSSLEMEVHPCESSEIFGGGGSRKPAAYSRSLFWISERFGSEQISRDQLIPCVLRIPASLDLHDDLLVTSSTIIFQTKASCLPPFFLMAKTNSEESFDVIDATAAPGNKTTFLGDLLRDRGTVFAFDRDEKRFKILSQRCEAFGSGNVVVLLLWQIDRMYSRQLSRSRSFLSQVSKREMHSRGSFLQRQRDGAHFSRLFSAFSAAHSESHQVSVAVHRARCEVPFGSSHQLFDLQHL